MGIAGFFLWLQRRYADGVLDARTGRPLPQWGGRGGGGGGRGGGGGGGRDTGAAGQGEVAPAEMATKEDSTSAAEATTFELHPQAFEIDNLYLDMNGLIHPCCHDTAPLPEPANEEEMLLRIFHKLEELVRVARPRKVLILAIDGVAPRSKMNQQRSRRFRAADERKCSDQINESYARYIEETYGLPKPPQKRRWDHNVITPATAFMERVSSGLEWFVLKKLNGDPSDDPEAAVLWHHLAVVFCDAHVPGEGEHKIMHYIRGLRGVAAATTAAATTTMIAQRAHGGRGGGGGGGLLPLPDAGATSLLGTYDPNTRHCIHGMDADLIVLGLATHEAQVSILRNVLDMETFQAVPDKYCVFSIPYLRAGLKRDFHALLTWFDEQWDMWWRGGGHQHPRGQPHHHQHHRGTGSGQRSEPEPQGEDERDFISIVTQSPAVTAHGADETTRKAIARDVFFERIVDDFVCLCFLVGNDFLPHMPLVDIKCRGIETLLGHYVNGFHATGCLTLGGEINFHRMRIFLTSFVAVKYNTLYELQSLKDSKREKAKTDFARRDAELRAQIAATVKELHELVPDRVPRDPIYPSTDEHGVVLFFPTSSAIDVVDAEDPEEWRIDDDGNGDLDSPGKKQVVRSKTSKKKQTVTTPLRKGHFYEGIGNLASTAEDDEALRERYAKACGKFNVKLPSSSANGKHHHKTIASASEVDQATLLALSVKLHGLYTAAVRERNKLVCTAENEPTYRLGEGAYRVAYYEHKFGWRPKLIPKVVTDGSATAGDASTSSPRAKGRSSQEESSDPHRKKRAAKRHAATGGGEDTDDPDDAAKAASGGGVETDALNDDSAYTVDSSEFEANIEVCCQEYLRGMQWVLRYYTHGCPDWGWYFPYHFAPLLEDVAKYCIPGALQMDMRLGAPLHPVEQLLAVLPRDSVLALPTELHDAVLDQRSPLSVLYPKTVPEVDYSDAIMSYHGVMRLPFINCNSLKRQCRKVVTLDDPTNEMISIFFMRKDRPAAKQINRFLKFHHVTEAERKGMSAAGGEHPVRAVNASNDKAPPLPVPGGGGGGGGAGSRRALETEASDGVATRKRTRSGSEGRGDAADGTAAPSDGNLPPSSARTHGNDENIDTTTEERAGGGGEEEDTATAADASGDVIPTHPIPPTITSVCPVAGRVAYYGKADPLHVVVRCPDAGLSDAAQMAQKRLDDIKRALQTASSTSMNDRVVDRRVDDHRPDGRDANDKASAAAALELRRHLRLFLSAVGEDPVKWTKPVPSNAVMMFVYDLPRHCDYLQAMLPGADAATDVMFRGLQPHTPQQSSSAIGGVLGRGPQANRPSASDNSASLPLLRRPLPSTTPTKAAAAPIDGRSARPLLTTPPVLPPPRPRRQEEASSSRGGESRHDDGRYNDSRPLAERPRGRYHDDRRDGHHSDLMSRENDRKRHRSPSRRRSSSHHR